MKTCKLDWCDRKHYSLGYCEMHYQRSKRGGDMTAPPKVVYQLGDVCNVHQCDEVPYSKSLCEVHYSQRVKGKPFSHPKRVRHTKPCLVPLCDKGQYSPHGLCRKHEYVRYQYRMTVETVMRVMWNAKCQACGSRTDLAVDHDHSCCPGQGRTCGNCTRGILCRPCNTALGLLQESPERIVRLLQYKTNPPVFIA